jgi:hypothetical protein
MIKCYCCVDRLRFPRFAVNLIGSDKKLFKKDLFDFCPHCFEYLFGTNILFSTQKSVAMSCHVCDNKVIESLPYSYLEHRCMLNNGDLVIGQRRMCGTCSARELFPIITSLLIVPPKG